MSGKKLEKVLKSVFLTVFLLASYWLVTVSLFSTLFGFFCFFLYLFEVFRGFNCGCHSQ